MLTRLGDPLTRAMSEVDGCAGDDCDNVQPADAACPVGDGWQVRFLCADCGVSWSRKWEESPVEQGVSGVSTCDNRETKREPDRANESDSLATISTLPKGA